MVSCTPSNHATPSEPPPPSPVTKIPPKLEVSVDLIQWTGHRFDSAIGVGVRSFTIGNNTFFSGSSEGKDPEELNWQASLVGDWGQWPIVVVAGGKSAAVVDRTMFGGRLGFKENALIQLTATGECLPPGDNQIILRITSDGGNKDIPIRYPLSGEVFSGVPFLQPRCFKRLPLNDEWKFTFTIVNRGTVRSEDARVTIDIAEVLFEEEIPPIEPLGWFDVSTTIPIPTRPPGTYLVEVKVIYEVNGTTQENSDFLFVTFN